MVDFFSQNPMAPNPQILGFEDPRPRAERATNAVNNLLALPGRHGCL